MTNAFLRWSEADCPTHCKFFFGFSNAFLIFVPFLFFCVRLSKQKQRFCCYSPTRFGALFLLLRHSAPLSIYLSRDSFSSLFLVFVYMVVRGVATRFISGCVSRVLVNLRPKIVAYLVIFSCGSILKYIARYPLCVHPTECAFSQNKTSAHLHTRTPLIHTRTQAHTDGHRGAGLK